MSKEQKQQTFLAKILVVAGFMLAALIIFGVLIRFSPGFIKLIGFLGAIASILVGWDQLSKINKNNSKSKEDEI